MALAMVGLATLVLAVAAAVVGGWETVRSEDVFPLIVSGVVGIAIGDSALFEALGRLGPRRAGLLFTANVPLAALLSALPLGERFSASTILGSVLILVGVGLAVAFGSGGGHQWEEVRGSLKVGIGFGLLSALGQASGLVVADPVFDGSINELAGGAVRAAAGFAGLCILVPVLLRRRPHRGRFSRKLWLNIVAAAVLGTVVAKTSLFYALNEGNVGVVSVLAGLAPVMQLPIIWAMTRSRPAAGAWAGATLAAIGTAAVVL